MKKKTKNEIKFNGFFDVQISQFCCPFCYNDRQRIVGHKLQVDFHSVSSGIRMSRHEGEKGGVSFSRRMETKIEVAGLPKVKVRLGVGLKHYLIFSIKYAYKKNGWWTNK